MLSFDRPHFRSARDWLTTTQAAIAAGRIPWVPLTRAELLMAEQHFPARLSGWLPSRENLIRLGLPSHFGRQIRSYSVLFRERFATTLETDSEFATAVGYLTKDGA